jgi:hypothetical protein
MILLKKNAHLAAITQLFNIHFKVSSFVEGLMSYLRLFFCVCLYIVVSTTYCAFALFAFVFYLVYPIFYLVYPIFYLVYPILPVSLDCPFLIVPSFFSNVYLKLYYILFNVFFTFSDFWVVQITFP